MDVRSGYLLILLCFLIVPAMADTGYFVHCNIDGARVIVADEVIGEIQEHECWVPWPYESNKEHLTIAADGYREIWDTLLQPWPGVPEHLYYRMTPTDPTVSGTDGDVRVLVQPPALNYVYVRDISPGITSENWEFMGDYYGTEFTLHYLPMGKKEIMIKRTNFVDVSQEVYVIPNLETDIAFEMVRTEEPEPLDAAASAEYTQPDKTVQKQVSILVIETPTQEPVVQVTPASIEGQTDTDDMEEVTEEKSFNTLGALILFCFVGMFIGVGWFIFNRIQLV